MLLWSSLYGEEIAGMLEECNVEAVELCVPWTETASEVTCEKSVVGNPSSPPVWFPLA
jgi:hypothetical protein